MALRRPPLARLIGRRVATLRAELGLTQENLAWEAGLESKGYLSRIESGQRVPSLDVLDRLARRLNVEPRDLLLFPDHDEVAKAMELVRRGGTAVVARVVALLGQKPTHHAKKRVARNVAGKKTG